jgi:hypothetical protein
MNVNVRLFKVLDITRLSMVKQLQALFEKNYLMHCVVACSKLDIYGSSITFYF